MRRSKCEGCNRPDVMVNLATLIRPSRWFACFQSEAPRQAELCADCFDRLLIEPIGHPPGCVDHSWAYENDPWLDNSTRALEGD